MLNCPLSQIKQSDWNWMKGLHRARGSSVMGFAPVRIGNVGYPLRGTIKHNP